MYQLIDHYGQIFNQLCLIVLNSLLCKKSKKYMANIITNNIIIPFGQMYSHKRIYSHVRNPKLMLARCYHLVLLTACVRAHFTHHLHAWPATVTITS